MSQELVGLDTLHQPTVLETLPPRQCLIQITGVSRATDASSEKSLDASVASTAAPSRPSLLAEVVSTEYNLQQPRATSNRWRNLPF